LRWKRCPEYLLGGSYKALSSGAADGDEKLT
jgi:hypothetical protein